MAKEMLDMLKEDTKDEQIRIAYGTIISDIKEVSKSYKEAKLALDVGKIFFAEKDIVAFTTLGIGRLIYQSRFRCARCLSERFSRGNRRMILMRRH